MIDGENRGVYVVGYRKWRRRKGFMVTGELKTPGYFKSENAVVNEKYEQVVAWSLSRLNSI